ncbi:MAG: GNVR domain-containing protein, partial [Smithella sp.]
FSDEYPDVIKTKAEIAELEKRLGSAEIQKAVAEKPDNPAYIALAAEQAGVESEIKSTQRQIEDLSKKKDDYRKRLEMSPRVEEGYKKLLVERNNTQAKYDDLMKKFMEARVAHGLEKGQMGERFTLIDPAKLPEKPVRPNRPAILLIGLILGICASFGMVAVQEATDHSARRSEDLTASFPFPVLVEIPEIVTLQDEQHSRRYIKIISGVASLSLVIVILIIHFFVIDLDVLWARIARYLVL